MSQLAIASHKTPLGVLHVVAEMSGKKPLVLSSGWQTSAETIARMKIGDEQVQKAHIIAGVSDFIEAYFDGELNALKSIAVSQPGGEYSQDVWRALHKVSAGKIVSYSELAQLAGRPSAVRAAASACARNLVAPFIPCHRVVRTDGSLGGYYYGLDKKTWLLNHEGVEL